MIFNISPIQSWGIACSHAWLSIVNTVSVCISNYCILFSSIFEDRKNKAAAVDICLMVFELNVSDYNRCKWVAHAACENQWSTGRTDLTEVSLICAKEAHDVIQRKNLRRQEHYEHEMQVQYCAWSVRFCRHRSTVNLTYYMYACTVCANMWKRVNLQFLWKNDFRQITHFRNYNITSIFWAINSFRLQYTAVSVSALKKIAE